ncbi:MAG: hypothetical protein M0T84_14700 [Betaproteobacteria bacterium]|nr:hypothetical protein [Betaproteobacteria bacterium]
MINRLAKLADIVPPQPVARPALFWWHSPLAWLAAAALALATAAAMVAIRRKLRRHAARRRLRRLAMQIRAGSRTMEFPAVMRQVLADAERSGAATRVLSSRARLYRDELLYSRQPTPARLGAFLDDLLR